MSAPELNKMLCVIEFDGKPHFMTVEVQSIDVTLEQDADGNPTSTVEIEGTGTGTVRVAKEAELEQLLNLIEG